MGREDMMRLKEQSLSQLAIHLGHTELKTLMSGACPATAARVRVRV